MADTPDIQKILDSWFGPDNTDEVCVNAFKRVFLGESGPDDGGYVLACMLDRLKFTEHCQTLEDMALSNFAKDLLAMIYWDTTAQKTKTDKLMNYIKERFKKMRTKNERVIHRAGHKHGSFTGLFGR